MLIHNGEHEDISITFYLWTMNCLFSHCECVCSVTDNNTEQHSDVDAGLWFCTYLNRKVKISCTKHNSTKMLIWVHHTNTKNIQC